MDRQGSGVEIIGTEAFGMIRASLSSNESLIVEPGAMASQDTDIECLTAMNGGFLSALAFRYLGSESFFINCFRNTSKETKVIYLSQPTPGQIIEKSLSHETVYLEPGSFIARTPGVRSRVGWAGFASFLAGEGLFRLCLEGTGRVWYGAYGAVIEKEIVGSYLVDSGHLLSYPPTIRLSIRLAGSLFSSFVSKEGLVLKLSGTGKVQLQTRSVKGLAQWLNPKFWR
jgi:uncharacterized protein (TIGR00266 family)